MSRVIVKSSGNRVVVEDFYKLQKDEYEDGQQPVRASGTNPAVFLDENKKTALFDVLQTVGIITREQRDGLG